MTVGSLIEAGLAYAGAKIRFKGEDEIVEVIEISDGNLIDSKGRTHGHDETAFPIIEPIPNVE